MKLTLTEISRLSANQYHVSALLGDDPITVDLAFTKQGELDCYEFRGFLQIVLFFVGMELNVIHVVEKVFEGGQVDLPRFVCDIPDDAVDKARRYDARNRKL